MLENEEVEIGQSIYLRVLFPSKGAGNIFARLETCQQNPQSQGKEKRSTSWVLLIYIWEDSRHSVANVRSPDAARENVEARERIK
jgi:hypothetical protein